MTHDEITAWGTRTGRDIAPWEAGALLTLDEILTYER